MLPERSDERHAVVPPGDPGADEEPPEEAGAAEALALGAALACVAAPADEGAAEEDAAAAGEAVSDGADADALDDGVQPAVTAAPATRRGTASSAFFTGLQTFRWTQTIFITPVATERLQKITKIDNPR